jgi:hypothetical protein
MRFVKEKASLSFWGALQRAYKQTDNCKGFQHYSIFSTLLISSNTVLLLSEELKLPCYTLSGQLNIFHTRAGRPVTQDTASCWVIKVRGSLQKCWQWRWWNPEDCVWRWSHVWALHAWPVKVHQKVHSTCHVDDLQTNQASYNEAGLYNDNHEEWRLLRCYAMRLL